MPTKRTLTRQLADLQRRYQQVVDERDEARKQTDTDRTVVKRLASQVTEARDERDELTRRAAARRTTPTAELRDTRRALMLSERARRSLTDQIAALQAANEAMCREGTNEAVRRERTEGVPAWEAAR